MVEIKYKNETINFSKYDGQWQWKDFSKADIKEVKAYIDKAHKKELLNITAITHDYRSGYKVVTVTSKANNDVCWVVDKDKQRSKESYLYANTPENWGHIEEMKKIDAEIKVLQEKKRGIEAKISKFKLPDKGVNNAT